MKDNINITVKNIVTRQEDITDNLQLLVRQLGKLLGAMN